MKAGAGVTVGIGAAHDAARTTSADMATHRFKRVAKSKSVPSAFARQDVVRKRSSEFDLATRVDLYSDLS